jgi:hypothetical protein
MRTACKSPVAVKKEKAKEDQAVCVLSYINFTE